MHADKRLNSSAWLGADLHEEGGDDGSGVDEAGDAQVLDALVAEDGGTSLEPGDVVGLG